MSVLDIPLEGAPARAIRRPKGQGVFVDLLVAASAGSRPVDPGASFLEPASGVVDAPVMVSVTDGVRPARARMRRLTNS